MATAELTIGALLPLWKGSVIGSFTLIGGLFGGSIAQAQLVPDGTLGLESSVVVPNVLLNGELGDRIEGGAERGANLFHSFTEFNIETGQRLYFANPVGIENILTRVTGNNASLIDGLLGIDGNANLFLFNPNQITFGPNASLDIRGSLTVSTAEAISLADGSEFRAVPAGNELLTFSTPLGVQFNDVAQGNITNQGDLAVGPGATLTLFGNQVLNQGALTAPGGTLQVLGQEVSLVGPALLNASSVMGGGRVLIGGDFQGQETVPAAQRTRVEPGVMIEANALEAGDGGVVVVWAEDRTEFAGQIAVRGGPQGGNGGVAETSGKQTLTIGPTAQVNASAPAGIGGLWLLDPSDITIDEPTATSVQESLASGTNVELTTVGGTGGSGDITVASSINATATNNATLTLIASRSIFSVAESTVNLTNGNLTLNLNQEIEPTEPTIINALATIGDVSGDVIVNLGAGTYQEGAAIALNRGLTLNGAGANSTILDGSNNADRVVSVSPPVGSTITLNGLTVTQGNVEGSGGGIRVQGAGDFVLSNSAITNNVATEVGGGLSLEGSTNVTIQNSTIANNSTGGNGGGIDLNSAPGNFMVRVENSTVSSNIAGGGGGGFSLGSNSDLILNQSTVTANQANGGGSGISNVFGGGVSLSNTIVSGNLLAGNNTSDTDGAFTDAGSNLVGGNAILGSLADNGGPTQTHALLGGSPAIDAAGAGAIATDQRGIAAAGVRDIGAYEARFVLTVAPESNQTVAVEELASVPLTVVITDEVTGTPVDGATLVFQAPDQTAASAVISSETAVSGVEPNSSGSASVDAVANGFLGDFQIVVDTPGSVDAAAFSLSNVLANRLAIVVDTESDIDDNNVGQGQLSLREALRLVSPDGTIGFDEGLAGTTIAVGSALPGIEQNLTLVGLSDRPTLSSETVTPLFNIGGSTTEVAISDLIVLGAVNWEAANTDLMLTTNNVQLGDLTLVGDNITVDGVSSEFGSFFLAGNNVAIAEAAATDLGDSVIDGTLNITSAGPITDSGTLSIGDTTTLNAGSSDIILDNPSNQFASLALVAENVVLREEGPTDLDELTIGNTLDLVTSGDITSDQPLNIGGNAVLDAGSNDISFEGEDNQFGALSLTGNDIQFSGDHAIAQNLDITATGTIFQNDGSLAVGGTTNINTTLANSGDVSISQSGSLTLSDVQVGGDFEIDASDVFQIGPLQVAGETQLNGALVDLATTVEEADGTFFVSGSGEVDLSLLGGLPSSIDGNLEVNVGATTSAFTTDFSGTPAISLNQPGNQFAGVVTLVTELPSTVGAPPSIIQSDALSVMGNVRLNAQSIGTIALENENNQFGPLELMGGTVSIQENDRASLGNSEIQGDLTVTARDVEIGSGLSVNGDLILQPFADNQVITIDANATLDAIPGSISDDRFRLDLTEIEQINAATPNGVTIGGSDGSGVIEVQIDATDPFEPPLTLRSPEGSVAIATEPLPSTTVEPVLTNQTLALSDLTIEAENISLATNGDITLVNTQLLGSQSAGTTIEIDTGLSPLQLRLLSLEGPGVIDAPLGFVNILADTIDATNAVNHDIVAGAVNIQSTFAQTLQNITLQSSRTPDNDIISTGLVQTTSGLDPSQGVNELPTNFSDAAGQIAAGCRANAGDGAQSEFVITGRGGLPKSPGDPLAPGIESVPWVVLPERSARETPAVDPIAMASGPISSSGSQSGSDSGSNVGPDLSTQPLHEAQGWATRADGQIFFVARSSTLAQPQASGLPVARLCSASIDD